MNSCPEECWPVDMKWKIALFDQPSLSPTSWIVKLTPNSSCCWNHLFQMLIVTVWNLSSHGIFGHTAENNFVCFNRRSELLILCNYFFRLELEKSKKISLHGWNFLSSCLVFMMEPMLLRWIHSTPSQERVSKACWYFRGWYLDCTAPLSMDTESAWNWQTVPPSPMVRGLKHHFVCV